MNRADEVREMEGAVASKQMELFEIQSGIRLSYTVTKWNGQRPVIEERKFRIGSYNGTKESLYRLE